MKSVTLRGTRSYTSDYRAACRLEAAYCFRGELTTVQQRGQNHQRRASTRSSIRMSRAMASMVPSDCDRQEGLVRGRGDTYPPQPEASPLERKMGRKSWSSWLSAKPLIITLQACLFVLAGGKQNRTHRHEQPHGARLFSGDAVLPLRVHLCSHLALRMAAIKACRKDPRAF
ncbi:hypothetical protein EYF80_034177 [Liparis tanakae]|uniref:Uncharacterized protein n=1 Tax=Liparis tanakae TaxID=230148 RepID=A0A4Z2GQR2_9TELE|nr:hypothetical protein EYF80_034177 [Liparis tanakae]